MLISIQHHSNTVSKKDKSARANTFATLKLDGTFLQNVTLAGWAANQHHSLIKRFGGAF